LYYSILRTFLVFKDQEAGVSGQCSMISQ
jgi:hypothetical protein